MGCPESQLRPKVSFCFLLREFPLKQTQNRSIAFLSPFCRSRRFFNPWGFLLYRCKALNALWQSLYRAARRIAGSSPCNSSRFPNYSKRWTLLRRLHQQSIDKFFKYTWFISPDKILKVVVFPAPFTPNKAKHSPCGILKEILSTATLNPSVFFL